MGIETFNRAERRVSHHPANPRRKTGQPAHFKAWKQEAASNRFLSKQRTTLLAEAPAFSSETNAIRIHAIAGVCPDWLSLLRADRRTLLKISDVGPATLKRLQHYFMAKGLMPAWAENA